MVNRAFEAVTDGPPEHQVRDAVEKAIAFAESNPKWARQAIWSLRGDRVTMESLEAHLGMGTERATLALGAALQLAGAELASPAPDLRSRTPELLCWLEGAW
jgi:hypothetical protein